MYVDGVAEKRVAGSTQQCITACRRCSREADQRLHGARCMFSSGQLTPEWPYVTRSGREREAADGAGLTCPASSPWQSARWSRHGLSRAPPGRTAAVSGRGLASHRWCCAHADRGCSFLAGGLGACSDAPRALSFPRKKSLTRTTVLKHPPPCRPLLFLAGLLSTLSPVPRGTEPPPTALYTLYPPHSSVHYWHLPSLFARLYLTAGLPLLFRPRPSLSPAILWTRVPTCAGISV
jgi:hypothetical protein